MSIHPIIEAAVAARTEADTQALETMLRDTLPGAHYRYVDDNQGNWSSITSGAEPTALVFERVTNMFDTLIEWQACKRNAAGREWGSPAEAVSDLFELPGGVDDLPNAGRSELAVHAAMALHDSDDSRRTPTLVFRDHGTGLTATQMPTTILSLNKSPKLTTKHAHGVFGKGGTTASQYSDATIIVTRRQPALLEPGEEDRVSVAVLRKGEDDDVRMPFLQYLVDDQGQVFSVPVSEASDFEPGTYIAHINYELGQAGVETWKMDQSIYAYAETVLFRPVLPYTLHDDRTEANTRPENRQTGSTVSGLGRRLAKRADRNATAKTAKSNSDNLRDFSKDWAILNIAGVGTVRLRWWLFADESSRRRMAARKYSVLFTSNGQTHHAWDHQRLQQLVPDLRRVGARLLVEVDCDDVPIKTRVQLFTSDRNAMRSSQQGKALEQQVVEAIQGDANLIQHEEDALRKALKEGAKGVTESFLSRLNQAIKIKTTGLTAQPTGGGGPDRPRPPKPVVDLYPEPTYFTGPEQVTVLRGDPARVYLLANAVDGFVPDRAALIVTAEDDAPDFTENIGPLRDGRMRVSIQIPDDAQLGTYKVNFALQWVSGTGEARSLDWDTKIEVTDETKKKDPSKSKPKTDKRGDVAFLWSHTRDETGWTDNTAGDLQFLSGKVLAEKEPKLYSYLKNVQQVPTVVLNRDFKDWATYRTRVLTKRGDNNADAREHKYGIAVGSAVAVICGGEFDRRKKKEAGKTVDEPMTPEQEQRAVAASARTALTLLPDLDIALGNA